MSPIVDSMATPIAESGRAFDGVRHTPNAGSVDAVGDCEPLHC